MPGGSVAVVTSDDALRAAVLRLAAVAGVPARAVDLVALTAEWHAAGALVVDAAAARACLDRGLTRRAGVVIACRGTPPPDVWPPAVALGAEQVCGLGEHDGALVEWLARSAEPMAEGRLLCCLPARGGAGASMLAAALALSAADTGTPPLLLDADPEAGGIDVALGIENAPGVRWPDLHGTRGVVAAGELAAALPAVSGVRVLSGDASRAGPLDLAALDAVLDAGLRGHPLVVADVPRAPSDVTRRLFARAETVVVVVPADVRAVGAAVGRVAEVSTCCRDVQIVVRHPGPGDLRVRDVEAALGLAAAAVWPWERRLGVVVDGGRFAREWRRTAVGRVAARLHADVVQARGAAT
jgi:secretion/DNA translocation related CpaE-like protein